MTVVHLAVCLSVLSLLTFSCRDSRRNAELEASATNSDDDREMSQAIEDIREQLEQQKNADDQSAPSASSMDRKVEDVAKQPGPAPTPTPTATPEKKPAVVVANNPGGVRLGETASYAQNGLCIHVFAASTANGANIRTFACENTDNQIFTIEYVNTKDFRLIAKHSGKCVSVNGGLTSISANINQQECLRNSDLREIFSFHMADNLLRIQNTKSGLCLSMDGTGNLVQDKCELDSSLFQRISVK